MQLGYFTLAPLLIITWFCLLVFVRNTLKSNTIQFNVTTGNNNFAPKRSAPPKNKIKYHVPKFMLELYEKNNNHNSNWTRPDVVRSLIPKHAGAIDDEEMEELSDNHLLIFDLPSPDEEEQFVSAELKILTLVEINSNLGVERQLKISIYDDVTKTFYNLKRIHVYHLNNTWLSFNVTAPVHKIMQKGSGDKFLKVVISVSAFLPYYRKPDDKFKLSLMPIRDDFDHDYPILLLSYTSSRNKIRGRIRKRRSIEEDYEEETNKIWDDENNKKLQVKKLKRIKNSCKRKPLYINFSEIDFDVWIVQPPGYEAYQCHGKCFYPVAEHLNPTKHAIVQALLHSVSPAKASRSCCVPTDLDSISILYIDSNGVLTYRYAYKDMVVRECGCR